MKHSGLARVLVRVGAIALMACCGEAAIGHGMIPVDTPVERLVSNLEQFIKEHPQDAEGYYRLGRVHTMALERKEEFVLAWDRGVSEKPAEGSWAKRDWGRAKERQSSTPEELRNHLKHAVMNLNKAIEIDPANPRFHLTLGCALEAGAELAKDVDIWPLNSGVAPTPKPTDERLERLFTGLMAQVHSLTDQPASVNELMNSLRESWVSGKLRQSVVSAAFLIRDEPSHKTAIEAFRLADWKQQIEEQYFLAIALALPDNSKAQEKPVWGGLEDWAAYEAANYYIRVVKARSPRSSDHIRTKMALATIEAFESLPEPNAITPIIFSLSGSAPLADLLSSERTTSFDLDGSGRGQRWPWLTPETGILVWDPERTGRITSGRQLFGSVSWWLFFRDGYQALDALDDNRDGELAGKELAGLAVWFDRNQNGVSDPGEVVPIEEMGIVSLATRGAGIDAHDGRSLVHPAGLRMRDGRVLATWDWVTSPVAEPVRDPATPEQRWIVPLATIVALGSLRFLAQARRT